MATETETEFTGPPTKLDQAMLLTLQTVEAAGFEEWERAGIKSTTNLNPHPGCLPVMRVEFTNGMVVHAEFRMYRSAT